MSLSNSKVFQSINFDSIFPWLSYVTKSSLRSDLLAALTGAIVVLPQAMAFATIAGMPPVYGLYTAMMPAIIAALFGSSFHLVSGPTTTASIRLYAFISMLAAPGSEDFVSYAITLTFLVGITEIVMGLLRLGVFVNFISKAVIVGFTAGVSILIIFKQLHNFVGIKAPTNLKFYEIGIDFFSRTNEFNFYVLAVGMMTLFGGLLFKKKIQKIPYMLGAMIIGSVGAYFLNLYFGGSSYTGIDTMEKISGGIPPLSFPDFRLATIEKLLPTVFATTLMTITECVSIGQSIATKSGQKLNANREFIAQGLSNIIGSFFSAYVASGSFNRSSVNYEAGAKTPLSAVFSVFFLIIILIFIGPLISYLPVTSMSAILFLVAIGIFDIEVIYHTFSRSKGEGLVLFITFAMTLLFSMESAILAGVMASFVYYLTKTSRPRVKLRVPNPNDPRRKFITAKKKICPQVHFVRVDGSIFFGSINYIEEKIDQIFSFRGRPKYLVLVAAGINFLDIAGAEFVKNLAKNKKEYGGSLFIYKAKDLFIRHLKTDGEYEEIEKEHVFDSKGEIIKYLDQNNLFDPEICKNCTARIFNECSKYPSKIKA